MSLSTSTGATPDDIQNFLWIAPQCEGDCECRISSWDVCFRFPLPMMLLILEGLLFGTAALLYPKAGRKFLPDSPYIKVVDCHHRPSATHPFFSIGFEKATPIRVLRLVYSWKCGFWLSYSYTVARTGRDLSTQRGKPVYRHHIKKRRGHRQWSYPRGRAGQPAWRGVRVRRQHQQLHRNPPKPRPQHALLHLGSGVGTSRRPERPARPVPTRSVGISLLADGPQSAVCQASAEGNWMEACSGV